MANNAVTAAKTDWLQKFDGAVTFKEISFGSPTVRHIYKRSYDQVGRNCHYISVFGRVLLGESQMSDAEDSVHKRAEELHKAFDRKLNATRAVLAEAGIEDTAQFNQPIAVRAAVIVPVQAKMLKCMALADEYLRLINTLWLEGEITDQAKSKAELELKQLLRGFFSTTRKMRVYLQNKVTEAQTKGTVSSSVAATDGGAGDDGSDSEAEQPPAAEGTDAVTDAPTESIASADEATDSPNELAAA